ncbi:hypothetical protein EVAR_77915_1 [Eumeta japonica]|uniref:Uncharacterized protein n=1 Tax=Eumeta variegata TaxID=151549 RepID=A0A4C1XVM4_EUMVA|nr:hypothetical protein EVAR_77915_1 [Eumeta japonica]
MTASPRPRRALRSLRSNGFGDGRLEVEPRIRLFPNSIPHGERPSPFGYLLQTTMNLRYRMPAAAALGMLSFLSGRGVALGGCCVRAFVHGLEGGRTARTSQSGVPSRQQSLCTESTGKPWSQRSALISSTGKSAGMPRITTRTSHLRLIRNYDSHMRFATRRLSQIRVISVVQCHDFTSNIPGINRLKSLVLFVCSLFKFVAADRTRRAAASRADDPLATATCGRRPARHDPRAETRAPSTHASPPGRYLRVAAPRTVDPRVPLGSVLLPARRLARPLQGCSQLSVYLSVSDSK